MRATTGLGEFGYAFALGAATFARVIVLIIVATVVWVPVGVWIGMNPKVTRLAQPIVQILAELPGELPVPLRHCHLPRLAHLAELRGDPADGAGRAVVHPVQRHRRRSAIPSDLREAMTSLQVSGWLKWRAFILPAIFSSYVTGGITAAGGAWNAAIVAEVVSYGSRHLTATGLGAYIFQATAVGDFPKILVGIVVMSFYVVAANRLVWRRLYALAERRYSL